MERARKVIADTRATSSGKSLRSESEVGRRMATLVTDGRVIPILRTELRPGPWQPRKWFDEGALAELADSLKAQGVLTPLRVVRASEGCGYLIIAGER